jgi:hypothetical protein
MKNTTRQVPFHLTILCSILMFFVSISVGAQTDNSAMLSNELAEQRLLSLSDNWESRSNASSIQSFALAKNTSTRSFAITYVNYKLNGLSSIDRKNIDKEFVAFSRLFDQVIKEAAAATKFEKYKGEWKSLHALMNYLNYAFQDTLLSSNKVPFNLLKIGVLPKADRSSGMEQLLNFRNLLKRVSEADWTAKKKLYAFKYLAFYVVNQPLIWAVVNDFFVEGAKLGGATTDAVLFRRLGSDRLTNYQHDSYIWRNAPRFNAQLLNPQEPKSYNPDQFIYKVESTNSETKVTLSQAVYGHELWFYFDKSIVLVDAESNEKYPIIRLENEIPLSKTFVVVGGEQKEVHLTLVFPRVKQTLKTFRLMDNISDYTNIQSDGNPSLSIKDVNLDGLATSSNMRQFEYNIKRMVDSLSWVLTKLDQSWDLGGTYTLQSKSLVNALKKAKEGGEAPVYCMPEVSYRLNGEKSMTEVEINRELSTFSKMLSTAYNQLVKAENTQPSNFNVGALKDWLDFMQYRISDLPLASNNLSYSYDLREMTPDERQRNKELTVSVVRLLNQYATTPGDPYKKLLAFKYLGMFTVGIPWVWKVVEPEFVRLSKMGGASLENLLYRRLRLLRAPYIEKDSRIWRNAPRFGPNQLNLIDTKSDTKFGLVKIELSAQETILTSRMSIGGYELWYYFDKSLCIVDDQTGDRYPIIRMSNQIPLSKTIVVEGCQQKVVEYTMTFPPLKESVKFFRIEQNVTNPDELMSDGSISNDRKVYTISDF